MKRVTVLICGLALALPLTAHAWDETQVYGIANFDDAGECTNGSTHDRHVTTAALFEAPFAAYVGTGSWGETSIRDNLDARGSYFTDATKVMSGEDEVFDSGIDDADVMFVHTHGGHVSSGASQYTNLAMGNASYNCSVHTDDDILLGQGAGDLDIAVVKACQSADYDVFINFGYRPEITDTTSSFTMWNGFHGNSSCSSATETEVDSYAWSSFDNGVGDNWLDLFYDDDSGVHTDDCPTSIVMGSSSSLRSTMYTWGGWWDRKATGNKTGSTMFYIGGCDPAGGRVLPN